MLSKTGAIFFFSKGIRQLFEDLKYFWRFEDDEQLKEHCHNKLIRIHKGAKMYLSYFIFGISVLAIVPIVSPRSLPMYIYVPDVLGTKFVWALESLTIPLITISVFAFDHVIYTFLQLTIMQFQLLNSSISKLDLGAYQTNKKLKLRLVKVINHHNFLLKFIKRLKRIMSLSLLVQLFNTVSALCIELYLMRNK